MMMLYANEIRDKINRGATLKDITIREKLLLIREVKQLTQEQMADLLEMTRTHYGNLEREHRSSMRYETGIRVDEMFVECVNGPGGKATALKHVNALYKCLRKIKDEQLEQDELCKYANMAIKSLQIVKKQMI